MDPTPLNRIDQILSRIHSADEKDFEILLLDVTERLRRLTSKMLRAFPGVHRWEETDDIFQNAVLRIFQALKSTTFDSLEDFFRFASLIIRRELIDLSRRYEGALGLGANEASLSALSASRASDRWDPDSDTYEPQRLAWWTEFHLNVDHLSEEERQVFDLLWYQELTQTEAASILNLSERTIQRRWQQARLKLYDLLQGHLPKDV